MNRMWMAITRDEWDVSANVFRTREEAIDWISVLQELSADVGRSIRTTDAEAGSPAMGETRPGERTSS